MCSGRMGEAGGKERGSGQAGGMGAVAGRAEGKGGRRKGGKGKGEREHDGKQESTPLYHPNFGNSRVTAPKGRLMLIIHMFL